MPHVVAEPCIKCKLTPCVDACPVDGFHEGWNFLVIHPEVCIDCGACAPVCPNGAIFTVDALPAKWTYYRHVNARYADMWPKVRRYSPPQLEKGRPPNAQATSGAGSTER